MLNADGIGWTDDRIAQLKALWDDGLSASQIAFELGGVSRNGVIGKIHRLKLGSDNRPAKMAKAPTRGTNRRPRKPLAPWLPFTEKADLQPEIVSNSVTLIDLEQHSCRWPVDGVGASTLFCGAQKLEGYAYCLAHCRMAYRVTEKAERRPGESRLSR